MGSFYQKKLPFELGKYNDEKGRLCISYWCRLYKLRITEILFEIISNYHVMPFDSGFVCMTTQNGEKYGPLNSISFHLPIIKIPIKTMSDLYGGLKDDRLFALLEQDQKEENEEFGFLAKQRSLPTMSKVNRPLIYSSKSFESPSKNNQKNECVSLPQSHSLPHHAFNVFADVTDDDKYKNKEDVI